MAKRKGALLVKIWKWLNALFLLSCVPASATEFQPWLGNIYEFEFRSSLIYQGYSKITSQSHLENYSSSDVFLHASLSNALPSFFGGEIEIVQARTRRQRGDVDHLKMTGRYVFRDDIAGDPLSLMGGISYIQAFQKSLKDVSSFHHGLYEGEVYLSVGKEMFVDTKWGIRWWSVLGLGCAEQGSPWMRFQLGYEKWIGDENEIRLFLDSLWGLGHKRSACQSFLWLRSC